MLLSFLKKSVFNGTLGLLLCVFFRLTLSCHFGARAGDFLLFLVSVGVVDLLVGFYAVDQAERVVDALLLRIALPVFCIVQKKP